MGTLEKERVTKVHLVGENRDIFFCSYCDTKKRIDLFKLRSSGKNVRIRCNCGRLYEIEQRQVYRKKTEIPCIIKRAIKPLKGVGIIKDISISGIKLQMVEDLVILPGDILTISFKLDLPAEPHVIAEAKVVRTHNSEIGCQVINWGGHEKEIYYYLLP